MFNVLTEIGFLKPRLNANAKFEVSLCRKVVTLDKCRNFVSNLGTYLSDGLV